MRAVIIRFANAAGKVGVGAGGNKQHAVFIACFVRIFEELLSIAPAFEAEMLKQRERSVSADNGNIKLVCVHYHIVRFVELVDGDGDSAGVARRL